MTPQLATGTAAPETSDRGQWGDGLTHGRQMGDVVTSAELSTQLSQLYDKLSHTITASIKASISDLQKDIQDIGDRTAQMEQATEALTQRQAILEDENSTLQEEVEKLKSMQEDLENRERRQNLRVRGIPNTVTPADLRTYLRSLFSTISPDHPPEAWRMDRAHRALGQAPAKGNAPKDVICRLHYYESKEVVINATRNQPHYMFQAQKLQIFNDLSPMTLAKRREMRATTLKLREAKIPYRWGFPFKLMVTRNGQQYVLRDAALGEQFLAQLGVPKTPGVTSPQLSPRRSTQLPAWNEISPTTRNQRSPGKEGSQKSTSPVQSSRPSSDA